MEYSVVFSQTHLTENNRQRGKHARSRAAPALAASLESTPQMGQETACPYFPADPQTPPVKGDVLDTENGTWVGCRQPT